MEALTALLIGGGITFVAYHQRDLIWSIMLGIIGLMIAMRGIYLITGS